MKPTVFLIAIFAVASISCERPPAVKDIDPNSIDRSKMRPANYSEMQSSPDAASAPYELQFIDTMIVHHEGAIDMALLADTRAGNPELKSLVEKIIAEQQKELATMKEWREKYFAGTAPAVNLDLPGMKDGMKNMDLAKLDALKGNGFDVEFIRQMIPQHEGAVAMAKDALAKAPKDATHEISVPFRNFAQSIVDTQTSEVAQMKIWLKDWEK